MDRGIMGKGGVCWLIPRGRETDTIRQMLRWKPQKQTWGRGGGVFSPEPKDDAGTELSGEGRAEVDEGAGNGKKNEKRRGRT